MIFSKETTSTIKGVAIILMIIHHCGFPDFWDIPLKELSSNIIVSLTHTGRVCVGIFTFMIGYGYAFAKKKNFKYSINHIIKLLIPFWVILLIFTIPVMYKSINIELLLLNLFGINSNYNWFSWFVAFYIFAMIIFPIISRFIDNSLIIKGSISILLFYLIQIVIHEIFPNYTENDFSKRLYACLQQTPCMILGYIFSKKKWFTSLDIPYNVYTIFFAIGIFIVSFISRNILGASFFGFNLDFIYAPLMIFSILLIFNTNKISHLKKALITFGNISVYMWFFHALFFSKITRDFYQPIVAISNYFWINTIWTIIVTFICSWGLMKLQLFIEKKFSF